MSKLSPVTKTNVSPPPNERRILVVSDGTGETASQMIKAALVQFQDIPAQLVRYKNIRNESQILAVCEEAQISKDLIIHTLVSPALRNNLVQIAKEKLIPTIDLIGGLLNGLSTYFGNSPKSIAGLLHDINDDYFHRIDAMEFTIAHDDGRELASINKADVVILGVSRTSKTPLSMYLSSQGWKVANIPLVLGFELPPELFEIDQRRIVGLMIQAETLATIRRTRLERLGQEQGGEYADPIQVERELEFANELFRRHRRWPVINVTNKALEETASEILRLLAARKIVPTKSTKK